ncbi:MAG: hypothetical protein CMO19_01080 [Thaumarchaeota archaeon]|nr:hypothetical protein [Nitrososphaerota archaeon]|tara:strand:+ start:2446 stop:3273 length:828 start_codon:yes stop_codon:yes gene_type:complete
MTNNAFSIKNLFPIILLVFSIQISSLIFTSNFLPVYQSLPSYQPAGNSTSGSILNSIILLIPTFVVTSVILFLLRRKLFFLLKFLLIITLSVGTFSVSYIILSASLQSVIDSSIYIFILSLILCIIPVLSITIIDSNKFQLFSSYILSSLYGTILAVFLKPPTIIIIPIAFALYDIYAVFRGPLKSIVNSQEDSLDLRPLFVNLGHFNIGTGDLIFYSMIPSSVFLLIDLPSAFLSIFLIHLGLILTLYLLKRFEIFPGLPIPVALSLVPYLLFY